MTEPNEKDKTPNAVFEPKIGMQFDDGEEAYLFFNNKYAR